MPDTLVINASPLIFLGNAGLLDLLRTGGASRFVVPQSVLDEVTSSQHTDRTARSVAVATWIERAAPVPIPAEIIEWDLGPGESAVVATCLHLGSARPVLDDLAGRRCARAFGLRVIGTVGVVVAAHRLGHIDDPRKVLLDLRASGMWISDAVIDQALRLAAIGRD
jgi:predicted nucleic acid-binding protein